MDALPQRWMNALPWMHYHEVGYTATEMHYPEVLQARKVKGTLQFYFEKEVKSQRRNFEERKLKKHHAQHSHHCSMSIQKEVWEEN
ncbi:7293_t:CDS:2 [Ambispora gerdemannii]|uniref:7293_t:CDS:1 n=1 Tax=Ambispora gerdemannii TaxID=144530 RepID=A0A9N9DR64_9GLOM|nr:7293_t:CDS:2 [Ambispora gerdemannii]